MTMRDQGIELMNAIVQTIDGRLPSTTGKTPPDFDTNNLDEWLISRNPISDHIRQDDPNATKRPIAYLRTYLGICGDRIPTRGIFFKDGSKIYLDKGVIKSLLNGNIIRLKKNYFELTEIGREFLQESFDG